MFIVTREAALAKWLAQSLRLPLTLLESVSLAGLCFFLVCLSLVVEFILKFGPLQEL